MEEIYWLSNNISKGKTGDAQSEHSHKHTVNQFGISLFIKI